MGKRSYKYIILEQAYADMNHIFEYISCDLFAENSANNLLDEFEEKIKLAAENPTTYPIIINEFTKRDFRKIVVKNFIIIYIVNDETNEIVILRVLNTKQN